MSNETRTKKPVPPQFAKKKEVEQLKKSETPENVILPKISEPIDVILPKISEPINFVVKENKKEINLNHLVNDLANNKYFCISEKEAQPIAERMIKEGAKTLHDVKWFLALFERVQLAKELAEKHGLS